MSPLPSSNLRIWRFLSYGGGVQTITLRLMIAKGALPVRPIDAAIFANTKREPEAVFEQMAWVEDEVARSPNPSPLYIASRGDLWEAATEVRTTRDGARKYVRTAIPAFFRDGLDNGMGRRSCTRDFKIAVVNAQARELMGKRRVYASEGVQCEMLMGMTTDEVLRIKANPIGWIRNVYPLIEAGMSRADCHAWVERQGYPPIVSSGCAECPWRTDWSMLKPHELARLPESERRLQAAYSEIGFTKIPYLHETRVPIDQIQLSTRRRPNMKEEQLNMFINECTGMCGV